MRWPAPYRPCRCRIPTRKAAAPSGSPVRRPTTPLLAGASARTGNSSSHAHGSRPQGGRPIARVPSCPQCGIPVPKVHVNTPSATELDLTLRQLECRAFRLALRAGRPAKNRVGPRARVLIENGVPALCDEGRITVARKMLSGAPSTFQRSTWSSAGPAIPTLGCLIEPRSPKPPRSRDHTIATDTPLRHGQNPR